VVTTPYHSEPTFFVKFQCLIKKFVHCFRLTQWHSSMDNSEEDWGQPSPPESLRAAYCLG
jgi:hypothetical protein